MTKEEQRALRVEFLQTARRLYEEMPSHKSKAVSNIQNELIKAYNQGYDSAEEDYLEYRLGDIYE